MRPLPIAGAPSQGSCTSCGDCCRVITLSDTKTNLLKVNVRYPADKRWIRDLIPVSPEEATQLAPHRLIDWAARVHKGKRSARIYKCPHFNYEAGTCGNYENRPPVCSGFPTYGDPAVNNISDLPRCGFWPDIKESDA